MGSRRVSNSMGVSIVEAFVGHDQQPTGAVLRVGLAAAVSQHLLLDPAAGVRRAAGARAATLNDRLPEVPRLGRMLGRCAPQTTAWHRSRARNGPPAEAINRLAKRIKRVAFGLTKWTHWRVRVLLYAGRPDWSKLATITPAAP
jgi:hypothetical protein